MYIKGGVKRKRKIHTTMSESRRKESKDGRIMQCQSARANFFFCCLDRREKKVRGEGKKDRKREFSTKREISCWIFKNNKRKKNSQEFIFLLLRSHREMCINYVLHGVEKRKGKFSAWKAKKRKDQNAFGTVCVCVHIIYFRVVFLSMKIFSYTFEFLSLSLARSLALEVETFRSSSSACIIASSNVT